jgi:hypothetical protein
VVLIIGFIMLNIYGQKNPHDPVIITGTRVDLIGFRNALDQAIKFETNDFDVFDSDGEEYTVTFNCIDENVVKILKAPSYYNPKNFN